MKLGKRIYYVALSAAVAASLGVGLTGCGLFGGGQGENKPSAPTQAEAAGMTIQKEVPTDGSKPTAYSGLENVAYMAYRLAHTEAYAAVGKSTVDTTVGFISYTQNVETYKDYLDGVMLTEDISTSSLVNTAMQTCFAEGRALWRGPASDKVKDWNGKNTEWETKTPSNYSVADYSKIYGLAGTEFSVYTLNEKTLFEWSEVTDNGDGTYTQTIYPDVEAASGYYAVRMKTMGNLSSYPTFHSIAVTYTFDEEWRVLSSETEENYAIDMGVLHSDNCTAKTTQTYTYERERISVSDYTDFFAGYIEKESSAPVESVTQKEPTATEYLSAAFAPVLVEPVQLSVTAALGGQKLSGSLYLDLAATDVRGKLNGQSFWYADDTVYLQATDGLLSARLDELLAYLLPATEQTQPMEATGLEIDPDLLLEELGGGVLQKTDDGATLSATLTFGEMKLPLFFSFLSDEQEGISLNYVELQETETSIGSVSAKIAFAKDEEPLPALTEEQKSTAVDVAPYVGDIVELAQKTEWNVDFALTVYSEEAAYAQTGYRRFEVTGGLQLNLVGGNNAELALDLFVQSVSGSEKSYYFELTVVNGELYLLVSYYNDKTDENYNPLQMKGNLDELSALLDTAQRVIGYDMPFIEDLLGTGVALAQAEENRICVCDLFDGLSVTNGIAVTLNLDQLYGADVDPLTLSLSRNEDQIVLRAQDITYASSPKGTIDCAITLNKDREAVVSVPVGSGEYVDISSLDRLANTLVNSLFTVENNVMNAYDDYYFAGKLTGTIGGCDVNFDVTANLSWKSKCVNFTIGANSAFAVNSGKYFSYLTFDLEGGMVYMQRYQYQYYSGLSFKDYEYPVLTSRSMTVDEFTQDYWNQLVYLTNMGSTLAGIVEDQINKGGSDSGTAVLNDVGSYLKGYTYNQAENYYQLTLNGGNFADFLGDMNLKLSCNEDGKLTRIYGDVSIYVLLSIDLEYKNVTDAANLTKTYVSYHSDVAADGNMPADGYCYDGIVKFPVAKGYIFAGWFVKTSDGYAAMTREYLRSASGRVEAYAVWIKDGAKADITTVEMTSKKFFGVTTYYWSIGGRCDLGGYAEGIGERVAAATGATVTGKLYYRISDDGVSVKDTLKSGNAVSVSGGAFGESKMTSLKSGAFGGATLTVTYTIGGVTIERSVTGWLAK